MYDVHVCMRMCVCVCLYLCVYVCMCVVCMCAYMYDVCVYVCVCVHVYVCMYVYDVCICVCVCVCVAYVVQINHLLQGSVPRLRTVLSEVYFENFCDQVRGWVGGWPKYHTPWRVAKVSHTRRVAKVTHTLEGGQSNTHMHIIHLQTHIIHLHTHTHAYTS